MITAVVAIITLLIIGFVLSSKSKQPKPLIHAASYTWEVVNIEWIKDGDDYQITTDLRAVIGREKIQMSKKTMRYICGGILTKLPNKPVPDLERTKVTKVMFNVLKPKTNQKMFPHYVAVSVSNGQCGHNGHLDAPYADVAKIGRLDKQSYTRYFQNLNGWKFKDFFVEKKNGVTGIKAIFNVDKNNPNDKKFPFIAACNVALYHLPVLVRVKDVEYDLSNLSEIKVVIENKKGIAIVNFSTSKSYTFHIENGLCKIPSGA